MPLDVVTVRSAKPGPKTRKLSDERGLYLEVTPTGGKWWRLKYRFDGKENRLSLGTFPDVSLKEARDARDEARALLRKGISPSAERKARKEARTGRSAVSLEVVTREWIAQQRATWNEKYADSLQSRFERNVFPTLGAKAMDDITAPEILAALRKIEERDAIETAHRVKGSLGQVFRYGIATGRCTRDPAADLRGALAPVQKTHHPAVTEPAEFAKVLRLLHAYEGRPVVTAALKLAPMLFVRPGELRKAEWKDVDLEVGEWRYVVTKTKTPHIVPLATQAVATLRELHGHTGDSVYVFPSDRSKKRPMSENGVSVALISMGLKNVMTGHGFRATARTILDEVLGVRVEYIEQQLAHVVKDPNGRAYNRTMHLTERRKMMQTWADYLDGLRASTSPAGARI